MKLIFYKSCARFYYKLENSKILLSSSLKLNNIYTRTYTHTRNASSPAQTGPNPIPSILDPAENNQYPISQQPRFPEPEPPISSRLRFQSISRENLPSTSFLPSFPQNGTTPPTSREKEEKKPEGAFICFIEERRGGIVRQGIRIGRVVWMSNALREAERERERVGGCRMGGCSKHAGRTTAGTPKGLEASATSLHSSGQDSGIVARASCHCSHSSSPSSGESSK